MHLLVPLPAIFFISLSVGPHQCLVWLSLTRSTTSFGAVYDSEVIEIVGLDEIGDLLVAHPFN